MLQPQGMRRVYFSAKFLQQAIHYNNICESFLYSGTQVSRCLLVTRKSRKISTIIVEPLKKEQDKNITKDKAVYRRFTYNKEDREMATNSNKSFIFKIYALYSGCYHFSIDFKLCGGFLLLSECHSTNLQVQIPCSSA